MTSRYDNHVKPDTPFLAFKLEFGPKHAIRLVSGVGAFEPFGSFAQRSIWSNVCFECREEESTIAISDVNHALMFENLRGNPQKIGHDKIIQRLM